MDLGGNIARLRTARGMTQEELANRLSVSRQTLSRWESGTTIPSAEYLRDLSLALEVTADELLNGPAAQKQAEDVPLRDPPPEEDTSGTAHESAGRRKPHRVLLIGLLTACVCCGLLLFGELTHTRATTRGFLVFCAFLAIVGLLIYTACSVIQYIKRAPKEQEKADTEASVLPVRDRKKRSGYWKWVLTGLFIVGVMLAGELTNSPALAKMLLIFVGLIALAGWLIYMLYQIYIRVVRDESKKEGGHRK